MAMAFLGRTLITKPVLTSIFSRSFATPSVSVCRFSLASRYSPPLLRLRPLVALSELRHLHPAIGLRCFSTRQTSSSLNDPNPNWTNRPPKETILLDGCDFEHWLIVLEKPEGEPTRDEIIDSYIKTLATVLGSEEEAKKNIYSVSTKHYFAFGCIVSEEISYKIKELPKVRWVLPDSYLDVKNKDYGGMQLVDIYIMPSLISFVDFLKHCSHCHLFGHPAIGLLYPLKVGDEMDSILAYEYKVESPALGEPFIDGKAVPYDPKYHEEWVRNNARANERSRRNDRPRNFDRSRNFERRRENMQNRDFQNREMPPMPNRDMQNPVPNTGGMPPNRDAQNSMPNTGGMPPNRDAQNSMPNMGGMPPNRGVQNSMPNMGGMPPRDAGPNAGWSNSMPNRDAGLNVGWSNNMPNRDAGPNAGWSNNMPNRDAGPNAGWSNNMPNRDAGLNAGWSNNMPNRDGGNMPNRDFQNRDVPYSGGMPYQSRDMPSGAQPNRDYQNSYTPNRDTGSMPSGNPYQVRDMPERDTLPLPNRDYQ
ncbi:hypothetical protein HHK36_005093 [Tetracentron sinense]|uniref:MORF/ORRM1/DAG-like MORF domain-containing protein n=1 Tax=Tetracentron sinense TaxID=13715 RepID=A0A835DMH8_TETSI|nr:hypothetical protein HHK36_005093 [Tetracentron sinense]